MVPDAPAIAKCKCERALSKRNNCLPQNWSAGVYEPGTPDDWQRWISGGTWISRKMYVSAFLTVDRASDFRDFERTRLTSLSAIFRVATKNRQPFPHL